MSKPKKININKNNVSEKERVLELAKKDIIESDSSRDSDKVSLLKELVAIAGMRDTEKKSESVTVFQGFSSEQLDAISGNNVKKIAEAKKEIES